MNKRVRRPDGSIYTEHWPTDPYEELAICCTPQAVGYDQRLRRLLLFESFHDNDVLQARRVIADAIQVWGDDGRFTAVALRQKAANIACGSDNQGWRNPVTASKAFGVAAEAACPDLFPK